MQTIHLWCNTAFLFIAGSVKYSSPSKTTPPVQIKWFFCDVIFLSSWWKRWEIYSFCRKDTVIDRGIHQTRLLLATIKWLICDVIADCHLLGERRNNKQDCWSTVIALAVQMTWVLFDVISLHRWWEWREI